MNWVNYVSLSAKAKSALAQGDGKRFGYAIDGKYIARLDKTGRAMDWILVIGGPNDNPTKGIDADTIAKED